jgi:hypothetical protein
MAAIETGSMAGGVPEVPQSRQTFQAVGNRSSFPYFQPLGKTDGYTRAFSERRDHFDLTLQSLGHQPMDDRQSQPGTALPTLGGIERGKYLFKIFLVAKHHPAPFPEEKGR